MITINDSEFLRSLVTYSIRWTQDPPDLPQRPLYCFIYFLPTLKDYCIPKLNRYVKQISVVVLLN